MPTFIKPVAIMLASNAHLGFCLFNNTSFSEVFHYKERLYNEYID
jgi:hypothetical protein